MGRVRMQVEYQDEMIELDHWADWCLECGRTEPACDRQPACARAQCARFFHVFMETDPKAPMYGKAPLRLASAAGHISKRTGRVALFIESLRHSASNCRWSWGVLELADPASPVTRGPPELGRA